MTTSTIYLIRHATPDWTRTDIPYHLPPGPPLTLPGEEEANHLGAYLRKVGVSRLFSSPLERCLRTAHIVAAHTGLAVEIESGLSEMQPNEKSEAVHARLWPVWQMATAHADSGPVALITHGGPIALLLAELGLAPEALNHYKRLFDRSNPLPPAGAWQTTRNGGDWQLTLTFTPGQYRAKLFV